MKLTIGVPTIFLFLSTLAMGQDSTMPFPQAANPSLVNGKLYLPLVVETNRGAAAPEAMASGEAELTGSLLDWHPNVDLRSATGSVTEPTLDLRENTTPADGLERGSPFPMAANPSR